VPHRAVRAFGRDERGASTLEFALGVLVLLALVFGIIEFGRAVWMQQALSAASREGSRYGIGNESTSGVPQYLDCGAIRVAAKAKVPDLSVTDADIEITYKHTNGTTSTCGASPAPEIKDGDRIVVTVSTTLDLDLPLVPVEAPVLSATDERSSGSAHPAVEHAVLMYSPTVLRRPVRMQDALCRHALPVVLADGWLSGLRC
jgi:Flp pilus assembly protein TadG